MSYKNNTQLLREQLGKEGAVDIFTTAVQTESFYAVQFLNESEIRNCTITNASNDAALDGQTMPAGTVIFAPFTAIELTSGLAIGYKN